MRAWTYLDITDKYHFYFDTLDRKKKEQKVKIDAGHPQCLYNGQYILRQLMEILENSFRKLTF